MDNEESLILCDLNERQNLTSCLAKWARHWLVFFQQLEIDHVIGEWHKELMSNSSGPAAIIRIFGVTKAVVQFVRGDHFLHNIAKLLQATILLWIRIQERNFLGNPKIWAGSAGQQLHDMEKL